jgi:hypothetical protein
METPGTCPAIPIKERIVSRGFEAGKAVFIHRLRLFLDTTISFHPERMTTLTVLSIH